MTDILIDDDEDLEDDQLEEDESPRTDSPDEYRCRWCDETFTGITKGLAMAARGRHEKKEHLEEWTEARGPQVPKRATGARKGAAPKSDRAPRGSGENWQRTVRDNVILFYRMSGTVLYMRDDICGAALGGCAEAAADAWVGLAKENLAVRRFWSAGSGATGWLALGMAHMPLAMAITQHHIAPALANRRQAREMMGDNAEPTGDLSGDRDTVVYSTDGGEPPAEPVVPLIINGVTPFQGAEGPVV